MFEHIIRAVAIALQAQVPVLLEGPPGDGKTRIVGQLLERLTTAHHTAIASLHEPTEFAGYPYPMPATETEPARVALLPLGWLTRLAQVQNGLAGLLLDEFSDGPPATRSAAQRGVLDRVWGETSVPNLTTAAAMNPPEISESGYTLSAPMANRFVHMKWDMPVDYWVSQMLAGFPPLREDLTPRLPPNWRERMPVMRSLVASFAKSAAGAGAIKALPDDPAMRSKPWPSLRSWTMAMELGAACLALGERFTPAQTAEGVSDVMVMLIRGCVGDAAAAQFFAYAGEMDLPDPESVLKDPDALYLPERGDKAFVVLTAVAAAVLANNTQERWGRAWKVLGKAVERNRQDIAAVAARLLAENPPPGKEVYPPELDHFTPLLNAAGVGDR